MKQVRCRKVCLGGVCIRDMVGGKVQLSSRFEDTGNNGDKLRLDEAAAMVSAFGPRIGVEYIQGLHRRGRQAMRQKKRNLGLYEAKVCQLCACRLACHLANPAALPLNAKKIAFRVGGGAFQQKAAFTAARIDFKRVVVAENLVGTERRNNGSG